MKTWNRVAIVGVGLIGGSIGLALARRGPVRQVVGIGRRPETLEIALRRGAIHSATTDLAAGVAEADLIIVCTPVDAIVAQVQAVAAACPAGALITDAGSTKAEIVAGAESLLRGPQGWRNNVRFLGGHPIAGNERQGPEHANENLFEGRVTVLTPTEQSSADDRAALAELWSSLGARVLEMTPDAHDSALAAISHVPHVLAAALAAATPRDLLPLVAGGWSDTTRIAAGDAVLWRQIFLSNRQHVLDRLDQLSDKLTELRSAIADRDRGRLEQLLTEAKRTRDAVGS